MFNIKLKGIYKNENQLSKGNLHKNSIMFDEPNSISESFLKGFLISTPFFILAIIACYLKIKTNNIFSLSFFKDNLDLIAISTCLSSLINLFIHEFLHAVCFPKDKIKELWLKPNELSAFIYCTAPLKKARFIWLCLCPNIILGLLPLLLWFIETFDFNKTLSLFMLIISFLNLLCGIGDYYNTYLVIRQVPKNALVQTHGLKAYWFIP